MFVLLKERKVAEELPSTADLPVLCIARIAEALHFLSWPGANRWAVISVSLNPNR